MELPIMELEIKIPKTSQKTLSAVNAYQQANKGAVNAKMRRYYDRLKNDPVRLAHLKERQKKRYEAKKTLKKDVVDSEQ